MNHHLPAAPLHDDLARAIADGERNGFPGYATGKTYGDGYKAGLLAAPVAQTPDAVREALEYIEMADNRLECEDCRACVSVARSYLVEAIAALSAPQAQDTPDYVEHTLAGTINWKMEVERLNAENNRLRAAASMTRTPDAVRALREAYLVASCATPHQWTPEGMRMHIVIGIRKLIEAAEAAPQAQDTPAVLVEGMAWHLIDTAPKDGTRIQLARVKMPKFQNLPGILWIKVGSWRAHFADGYEDGWREDAVAGPSATDHLKLSPTHWAALPTIASLPSTESKS